MNKALLKWLEGGATRHVWTYYTIDDDMGPLFYVALCIDGSQYMRSSTGHSNREAAEGELAKLLVSEAAAILSASDD